MHASAGEHPSLQILAHFAAGKLSEQECEIIEEHLAECSECTRLLAEQPPDSLLHLARQAGTAVDCLSTPPSGATGPTCALLPSQTSRDLDGATPALPADLLHHTRYHIIRLLGQGGMGAVYQAEHRLMERMVALKVINPGLVADQAAIERFQREVKTAAKLQHPNIVTAHDAEQAGQTHLLVMEYVAGQSLAAYLQEKGRLPIAEACHCIRQAALGLQHAHEHGLVHRDIKPDNLMRTTDGVIKILDFGLARLSQTQVTETPTSTSPQIMDSHGSQLTLAGSVMGTPDYLAPEQAGDSSTVDIRADIYSLGCTFYQLLTGQVPFPDGTMIDKLRKHVNADPLPVQKLRPEVPAELAAILARMMDKKPERRYQSPAEVAEVLRPFAEPAKPPRRWPMMAALVLALAGLLGLAGVAVYRIQTEHGELVIERARAS